MGTGTRQAELYVETQSQTGYAQAQGKAAQVWLRIRNIFYFSFDVFDVICPCSDSSSLTYVVAAIATAWCKDSWCDTCDNFAFTVLSLTVDTEFILIAIIE